MAAVSQSVSAGTAVSLAPARSPQALLWLWATFWLLMITISIQDALRNPRTSWWEPILWEGSSALVGTCWMLFALRTRERHEQYLDRPLLWFSLYLRWLPVIVLTFVCAAYAIRHGVYEFVGRIYEHPPWASVFIYESVKVTLFSGLWLGILFGFDSYTQWQRQQRRLLELQREVAEAQLSRLKGQLQPHFLFNALNTISALMQVDVARADRLVAGLGDLLRISLRSGDQEMTPLAEELRTVELYGQIMQERFRDRVSFDFGVDKDLLNMPIPAMLLQPLIENAFKHAVETGVAPVHIEVRAGSAAGSLEIVVRNTGTTLSPDYREGVGLRNCRARLRIIYGSAASLRIRSEGDAVAASVSIPLDAHRA